MSHQSELPKTDVTDVSENGLGSDSLHVWYAWIDKIDCSLLESQLSILSQVERQRFQSFYFAPDRHRFLAAHLLKRYTLAKYLNIGPNEIEIELDSLGKPYLSRSGNDAPIQFNMTHTHGLVACAVANRRIGIDAEFFDRKLSQNAMEMFLAKDELHWIQSLEKDQSVKKALELWTLKEAYLKATGVGLHQAPKNFSFHQFVLGGSESRAFQSGFNGLPDDWHFFQEFQQFDGYVVATAVEMERCDNLSDKVPDKVVIRYLNGTSLLQ